MSLPKRLAVVAAVVGSLAALAFLALFLRWRPDPGLDMQTLDWGAIARRFHRGPGPCLRYWKARIPEAELKEVVDGLVAAGGTCEGLRTGSLELVRRGFELDGPEHAASEADELAQVAEAGLPWWGPWALRLQGVDLRKTFAPEPGRFAKAADAWATVPTLQKKALDDAWHRKPTAFVLGNVVRLIHAMNVRSTQDRLDSLAHLLEAARDTGRSAGAAEEEIEALPADERRDCWNTPIEVAATDGGLRLRSLGEDEVPGGVGADADLERVVAWENDAPEPAGVVAGIGPADCGPIPASVDFRRAEIERVDMDALARQARIVPFFEKGTVVGFKLSHVTAASLFTRLGLCDGDIVNITGVSPMDPSQALDAYTRFHSGEPVELRVRRGAQESTVVTQIR